MKPGNRLYGFIIKHGANSCSLRLIDKRTLVCHANLFLFEEVFYRSEGVFLQ
jgi:hypothetical protein